MADQDTPFDGDGDQQEQRLAGWVRFFAVIYRIVLVVGLLALVAGVVLLFVVDWLRAWILLLPAALIILGILLARVEYRLDLRRYHLHNPKPKEVED